MDDGRMSVDEQLDVEGSYSSLSLEELMSVPEVDDCTSCVIEGD